MMKMEILTVVVVVILFTGTCCGEFKLSLIHFNDFHASYEPVNNISTTCEGQACIGGFSRLFASIKRLRQQNPDAILLNAGDNFQGSLWYIVHKWNVTQHFMNKLSCDATTLGNHEFDDGIDGLVPFLTHLKSPVVVSNINASNEPRMQSLYKKSVVIERNGRKIGIVGVLLNGTTRTSHTENLIFEDEIESVKKEAQRLERENVFTIIVLSHYGYQNDVNMAKRLNEKVSIIVGGHTHSLLYTGVPVPGPDTPLGPYPTIVTNLNGGRILVVQASSNAKYLGNLSVSYDDLGSVNEWDGNPIFLAPELPTDDEIDAEIALWKIAVDERGKQIVGRTKHTMPNTPCRQAECPLGNFATDAMISNYVNKVRVSIAMIHAGGMRTGIQQGNITFSQLVTTFPFEDTINICVLQGMHLKLILESCMDDKHLRYPHMFQVSGLQVVFNISKNEGERVQVLKVRCQDSTPSKFEDFKPEEYYRVLLPTFLSDTNFNPLFNLYIVNKTVGERDTDVYVKYLKLKSPIDANIENRIQIVQ